LPRDFRQARRVIDQAEVVPPARGGQHLLDLLFGFVRVAGARSGIADDM
jgi:hypothetical protein